MSDQLTIFTDLHKEMNRLLASVGFEMMEEVNIPPYMIDTYIPKYHIAFEADGPMHSPKHDKKRDNYLWVRYHLPVMRFTEEWIYHYPNYVKQDAIAFAQTFQLTAKERLKRFEEECPWL